MSNVVRMPRHGQAGYYALADLPQRESVFKSSIGVGWPDAMDKGLRLYPGQFVVTTGIAGSGKSTFWLNVVANIAADYNYPTFMYVPENEGHIMDKLKRIWGIRPGWEMFQREMCYVQSCQPEHYGAEPKTLQWVLERAATAIERDGVRLVLLDPWNEIERAKPKDQSMTDYIGECLTWLKGVCRYYEVTVSLIAHPTKEGIKDGKVPRLSDIEGSMNWFNKMDNGLVVNREAGGATHVTSAKVREKGAGLRGNCIFDVDEKTEQFSPVSWEAM